MPQPVAEELLILTRSLSSPSAKYRETTCVAAVNRQGEMRRLFPVPYRLLEGKAQFQKWEWINARLTLPGSDHRPESRRLDADSIVRPGHIIKLPAVIGVNVCDGFSRIWSRVLPGWKRDVRPVAKPLVSSARPGSPNYKSLRSSKPNGLRRTRLNSPKTGCLIRMKLNPVHRCGNCLTIFITAMSA